MAETVDDKIPKYYTKWARKKNLSIFLRSHLSNILAVSLAILTIIREVLDIFFHDLIHNEELWVKNSLTALIIILIIGTIGSVIWEYKGKKLEVSQQEKQFAVGMRELLLELERLKRRIDKSKDPDKVDKLFNDFVEIFLKTSRKSLCGDQEVNVGLMLHDSEEKALALTHSTYGDEFPEIYIKLKETEKHKKGPAQKAFEERMLAHMPDKSQQIGWLYDEEEEEKKFRFGNFFVGWFEPPPANSKHFVSVISIPITSYANPESEAAHGVLNFTTQKKDYFIPRDYLMGYCFASIIAQAIDAARFGIKDIEKYAEIDEDSENFLIN